MISFLTSFNSLLKFSALSISSSVTPPHKINHLAFLFLSSCSISILVCITPLLFIYLLLTHLCTCMHTYKLKNLSLMRPGMLCILLM